MSGISKLIVGAITQGKSKGKKLVSALGRMNSAYCEECGSVHKKDKHNKK